MPKHVRFHLDSDISDENPFGEEVNLDAGNS